MSNPSKPVVLHARIPDCESSVRGSSLPSQHTVRQQLALWTMTQGLFYLVIQSCVALLLIGIRKPTFNIRFTVIRLTLPYTMLCWLCGMTVLRVGKNQFYLHDDKIGFTITSILHRVLVAIVLYEETFHVYNLLWSKHFQF